MTIRFWDLNKIDANVGPKIIASAKLIHKNVKVDYITTKHVGFSVTDPRYNTKHSVLFFGEREFPKCWSCDCKWFSLKQSFCKHIIAVFMRLNSDSKFLSKLKKETL